METKPDFWDWVTPRAKCCEAVIFELLYESVESNVQTANSLERSKRDGLKFQINRLDKRKFVVVRSHSVAGFEEHSLVTFRLDGDSIRIAAKDESGAEKAILTAGVSFLQEGDCRMIVDGQSFQPWQVCHRALESLFFVGD